MYSKQFWLFCKDFITKFKIICFERYRRNGVSGS